MRTLYELSARLIDQTPLTYVRDCISVIDGKDRMIGIKGSRGAGKTTLLLQYLKIKNFQQSAVYITLEDLYFSDNRLIDFADSFVKNGGRFLFIDEVHHYPNWSKELKLIYDRYPELKVVFTGSSLLHIRKSKGDLARRMYMYNLNGLSFREYINITEGTSFSKFELPVILENHQKIANSIRKKIKPVQKYNEYIAFGYYPFFLDNIYTYSFKLAESVNLVLESDIPFATQLNVTNIEKIKQLLYIIGSSVPFKPNIQKLSERTGISRNTLKLYFYYLSEAKIIYSLYPHNKGVTLLTKPEKVYLYHPNLMSAIARENENKGTLRETFFLNQVGNVYPVNYPIKGDFFVSGKYTFEIGGKNKNFNQISNMKDSYLALDDIETGFKNEIPLWLFGFLY